MCNEIEKYKKTEDNLKVCHICGRVFNTYKSLKNLKISINQHLRTHDISIEEYYKRFYDDVQEQKCTKCDTVKPINEFYYRKDKSEYRTDCIECHIKQKQKNYIKIRVNKLKYNKEYYKKNKKFYTQSTRNRRHGNLSYRIATRLSNQVRKAFSIQNVDKNIRTRELIGCNTKEFIKYFESLFQDGMTWENHGFGENKWHYDHIIPCSSFDLTDLEQQKKCFHYTNYQPLWQRDNLSKGKKLNYILEKDKK